MVRSSSKGNHETSPVQISGKSYSRMMKNHPVENENPFYMSFKPQPNNNIAQKLKQVSNANLKLDMTFGKQAQKQK